MQADSIIQEKDHKRQIEGLTKKYEEKISQLETQIVRLKVCHVLFDYRSFF